jgi:hypothetical protein
MTDTNQSPYVLHSLAETYLKEPEEWVEAGALPPQEMELRKVMASLRIAKGHLDAFDVVTKFLDGKGYKETRRVFERQCETLRLLVKASPEHRAALKRILSVMSDGQIKSLIAPYADEPVWLQHSARVIDVELREWLSQHVSSPQAFERIMAGKEVFELRGRAYLFIPLAEGSEQVVYKISSANKADVRNVLESLDQSVPGIKTRHYLLMISLCLGLAYGAGVGFSLTLLRQWLDLGGHAQAALVISAFIVGSIREYRRFRSRFMV